MAEPVAAYPLRTKTAAEVKTLTFDFTAELAPNSLLTGTPTLAVTGSAAGSLAVTTPTIDPSNMLVSALISGGGLGDFGIVACQCDADDGQVHEICAAVEVAPDN